MIVEVHDISCVGTRVLELNSSMKSRILVNSIVEYSSSMRLVEYSYTRVLEWTSNLSSSRVIKNLKKFRN